MSATNSVFRIAIDESKRPKMVCGEKCLRGLIQIGEFTEQFDVPIGTWAVSDYRHQWQEGLDRFLSGTMPACVVTGMRDPSRGTLINTWALYVDHGKAVLQNQILLCKTIRQRFNGHNFYDFIEPRETHTEDGEPISEWVVSRSSIVDFLKTIRGSQGGVRVSRGVRGAGVR